eukprot:TRINITY_DN4485_c0_g2_i1.p1 TRINITY_DN4485_c0_g2~~TRINITY_DN4485_c0_g2_i1.p1  ORF type:complete len:262 (-),score=37.87 TRINITY_DN4485_c0_g2_i1:125-838(-)
MDNWATTVERPSFILALGDNFYPCGPLTIHEDKFKTNWIDVYLHYETLRVPWKVILGNHDYIGNPDCQIAYTKAPQNPQGLWQMPDRNYTFQYPLPNNKVVEFFGLDTNGAQGHVRTRHPQMRNKMFEHKEWLATQLQNSNAHWKIVFAHHPLYTKGQNHGTIGDCLREPEYTHKNGTSVGYGLEKTLLDGQVDAYFSGHEHVFQHHKAHGIYHFVCGACSGDRRFYGGMNKRDRLV